MCFMDQGTYRWHQPGTRIGEEKALIVPLCFGIFPDVHSNRLFHELVVGICFFVLYDVDDEKSCGAFRITRNDYLPSLGFFTFERRTM